jgi:hypothetical protein
MLDEDDEDLAQVPANALMVMKILTGRASEGFQTRSATIFWVSLMVRPLGRQMSD